MNSRFNKFEKKNEMTIKKKKVHFSENILYKDLSLIKFEEVCRLGWIWMKVKQPHLSKTGISISRCHMLILRQ